MKINEQSMKNTHSWRRSIDHNVFFHISVLFFHVFIKILELRLLFLSPLAKKLSLLDLNWAYLAELSVVGGQVVSEPSFWATDKWTQFPPESTWILSVVAGNLSALGKKCCVAPAALLARPECSCRKTERRLRSLSSSRQLSSFRKYSRSWAAV